jgi:beta-glucanase (GH16 family)
MQPMSIRVPILFAVALLSPLVPRPALAEPPAGYKLVWSDEFEGAKLDAAKWVYRTDSKHWSTQKPGNVTLADGKLKLNVKREEAGDKHYTGAGVISKQAFKYGYYESRFKVPPGAGWHTSFWMMKHNGKGGTDPAATVIELDCCENDSVNLHGYGVNTHPWNPKPHKTFGNKHVKTPDLAADFHVWGCEFTSEIVKYYFDGKVVQTVDATKFPHGESHIWLTTIASHLGKTKAVDDSKLPAAAEYDYVRFYEKGQ